jgi:hypothetical protein
MNTLRTLAIAVAATALSCGKDGGSGKSDPKVVSGGPESFAKAGSSPPVVVTFNVSFAENVNVQEMQDLAGKFETVNLSLWNVTEGQIRIGRVRMRDNAHPGSKSVQYNQLNLAEDDIVVWSSANFNGPGTAFVAVGGSGRFGRIMGIPSNIANTTWVHEMGHFLFELSWAPGPVLIDEYDESPHDVACVMELNYVPLRFCSATNHVDQPGQPHSCWTQILLDYPDFTYTNTNTAPDPPPAPLMEFSDTP